MKILSRELVINNQSLTYYKFGKGKPVVFLHGGRVRALTFRKFLTLLAKDYTVIAPDIPGYGNSFTPTTTWSFTEYGQFFEDFLAALKLNGVPVIGYSMGGGIALNLAAQNRRVAKLILINTSGLHKPSKSHLYYDFQRTVFFATHPSYVSSFLLLLKDHLLYLWKHVDNFAHMASIRRSCFEKSYCAVFNRISIPTLILWGRDDSIYPIEMAYELRNKLRWGEVKIVSGTHDWLVYNPSSGISQIRQYLT